MSFAAALLLISLASPQHGLKDEVAMKGMRIYARCWRTPTGDDPYMIWTIGSRDDPPAGQTWRIKGETIAFDNLPIVPAAPFTKAVAASDPAHVDGVMVIQPDGKDAKVAVIEGALEKVETLVEDLPLGDVTIVEAEKQIKERGPAYHLQIDRAMKLTTPSGLTIEIPKQDAKTNFTYGSIGPRPTVAIHFHPNFKESMDSIPGSDLFKRLGGPIEVEARLKGLEPRTESGFVGGDYVAESEGFGIKPGPVKGVSIEITQTIVLQSYPLEFRVPVLDSK